MQKLAFSKLGRSAWPKERLALAGCCRYNIPCELRSIRLSATRRWPNEDSISLTPLLFFRVSPWRLKTRGRTMASRASSATVSWRKNVVDADHPDQIRRCRIKIVVIQRPERFVSAWRFRATTRRAKKMREFQPALTSNTDPQPAVPTAAVSRLPDSPE
jgi:hypothetical protein